MLPMRFQLRQVLKSSSLEYKTVLEDVRGLEKVRLVKIRDNLRGGFE